MSAHEMKYKSLFSKESLTSSQIQGSDIGSLSMKMTCCIFIYIKTLSYFGVNPNVSIEYILQYSIQHMYVYFFKRRVLLP
jgi:hypothetical protein